MYERDRETKEGRADNAYLSTGARAVHCRDDGHPPSQGPA
jgi:hypothetical protein